jgi:cell division protein FtsB
MTETAGGRQRPERSHFTSRAAVLAVVVCAIALSLAYPVREYIAQRRQIDQLETQRQEILVQLRGLQAEHRKLTSSAYIEQQARDKLHMCFPAETCYETVLGQRPSSKASPANPGATAWYQRLWSSVQQADKVPGR